MTKTFTLLLSATLMGTSLIAEAAPNRVSSLAKKKAPRIERNASKAYADAVKVQYLPITESVYFWDEDAEDWVLAAKTTNTYNPDGTIASTIEADLEIPEEPGLTRYTYAYNENGKLVETTTEGSDNNGETWSKVEMNKKAFDTVVTDFATENLYYYWDADWTLSYGNKYHITRNEAGTLTLIGRQAPKADGEFEDIARVTNTTTADGKTVTRSTVTEMDSKNEWNEYLDLRDIVWANTDGQVLNFDVEDYARGRNRIASAKSYYEGEYEAELSGEYANDFEGSLTFEFVDESNLKIGTRYTDAATGSYIESYEVSYPEEVPSEDDINGDGVVDDDDYTLEMIVELEENEYELDQHGNIVLEKYSMYLGGELEYCSGIIYDYAYNADGALIEFVSSSFEGEEEYSYPEMRIVYSDFITAAGIDSVLTDNDNDAPVEYYNLQGLRVAHPEGGIFIRRQGSKVSKVRL